MNIHTRKTALIITLLAGASLLSACDRANEGSTTSTSPSDSTSATTGATTGTTSGATTPPADSTTSGTATPGQAPDGVVTRTDRDAAEGTRDATSDARETGRDAGQAIGNATDTVVDKTKDIAITTAINAKLAADERLSALKINVDTENGRVVLRGSAPDTASRTRATDLARTVDGVSDVNNELSVQPAQ